MIELAYLLRCAPADVRAFPDGDLATLIDVVKDASG